MNNIGTLSDDMERKLLHEDLLREKDSDEEGPKARLELDSDFSLSEEEENAVEEEDPNEGKENWSELLTKTRAKHNTGPKGVKADYEEAKRIVRRRNETKKLMDQEAFKRAAYGATTNEDSVSFASTQAKMTSLNSKYVKAYDGDADDDEDEDSDDDEFLEAFRKQRLDEMNKFTSMRRYGRVIPVDKFGFLDETDNVDPETFVVVHLYEDYINACKRMNQVLDQFAMKHQHVKVLKLVATEASQTLSHRALPAFLVYKNKELVDESSVGMNEHAFGVETFGIGEVEYFLASKYGIPLSGVTVSESDRKAINHNLDDQAHEQGTKWQASSTQTLGRVNLFSNRISKRNDDGDDDDDDW